MYSIEEPIDAVFSSVEDLVEIRELAGHPFSSAQIVDLGLIIISKHRIFSSYVRKWMQRPIVKQKWVNFKDDFTAVHHYLRDTDATVDKFDFLGLFDLIVLRSWA